LFSSLFRFAQLLVLSVLILLPVSLSPAFGQPSKTKIRPKPVSRRISFVEGQKLVAAEPEGNLSKQTGRFTRTRLADGRVLELYYPISTPNPARRARPMVVPGYGVLYESEAAFNEATRPRHMLEELIPDGRAFLDTLPQIIARLEKRTGKLNYTRESLRRLDGLIAGFHSSHTTAQTDPKLFQEITAYYGETLRRALQAEWRIREEKVGQTHIQTEPNLALTVAGKPREIKPWSRVITALFDEESRGIRLSKVFDADLAAAR
jgi:hypothetical protein